MEKTSVPEKNGYCIYERGFTQKENKEAEFEEILPEYLPPISKIIFARVIPVVRHQRLEKNVFSVGVRCVYKLLYVSDYKKQLKSASFTRDMEFCFEQAGGDFTDGAVADAYAGVGFVSASALSQRRIAIRAGICVYATVFSPVFEEVPMLSHDDGIIYREKSIKTVTMSRQKEQELHLSDEIVLEGDMPAVAEIVDASCDFCVCSTSTEKGRMQASGVVDFRALYRTNDSSYICFKQDLPFVVPLADENVSQSIAISPVITPTSLTVDTTSDSYGEQRVITFSISADVDSVRYAEENATVYEDAFCRECCCNVEIKPYPTKRIANVVEESFKIESVLDSSSKLFAGIIDSSGTITQVTSEYIDGKIVATAKASISLLGENVDGDIVHSQLPLSLKLVFSAAGSFSSNISFDTYACISSVDCRISGNDIVCTTSVCARCIVSEAAIVHGVYDIEQSDEKCEKRNPSEYVIYYPTKEDTLWSVAKKYKISPEALATANKLNGDSIGKKAIVIPME